MNKKLRIKSIESSLAETQEQGHTLKRSLGVMDLAVMGIAVAVGAGIFSVGAQAAALHAGPAVIVSFIIAGIVCGLAIMCYAEFASSLPVAGSAYTFTYSTMGEIIAWIIGWDLILEMLMAGAVISKYWGIYLAQTFSLFGINIPTSVPIGPLTFSWPPLLVVAAFTILLVRGTKLSSRVNMVFTLIKVAIVLFVIVVGFSMIKAQNFTPFIPPAEPSPEAGKVGGILTQSLFGWLTGANPSIYGILGILSGASLVFFAFIGFDVVATSAEETKDPHRTVPRGIMLGLGIVTTLYVLVSVVITGLVSYKVLAKQDDLSLATAFHLVGADWAARVISLGALVGLTTVVMVLLLGLTRIVFAMSRDGLLPRSLSTTRNGVPARLQIIVGVVIALIASFTNVEILSDMINIGTLSAFVLVCVGVPILRKTRPDLDRPFRVPGSPILPWIAAAACAWLMVNLTVETWIRFIVWLVIGFVVYFAYSRKHSLVGKRLATITTETGREMAHDQQIDR